MTSFRERANVRRRLLRSRIHKFVVSERVVAGVVAFAVHPSSRVNDKQERERGGLF